ncbi:bifunctional phosphatase PAP2/diacylglycerol kinase family protein [Actinomycetota bacterium Odt1-20B]
MPRALVGLRALDSFRVLDRRMFLRVAESRLPGAEQVLPRLSRAANHGRLWFATAGALAAAGGPRARRAAVRGAGALALASLATNTVAKYAVRRPRPAFDAVPLVRRLVKYPHTSSFPSGHSASAAAFACGVALESWRGALVVAPLAAAVAFSRVYVGVHYPSDVLAGCAIGAAAAAATCYWWPPRVTAPGERTARADEAAPALPRGAGLTVIVNSRSGAGVPGRLPADEHLKLLLPEAQIVVSAPGDDLGVLLDEAAHRARKDGGALGVCGGDGTVNAAARRATAAGVPLAVFPGGTLNHFALDADTQTFEETAHAVEYGQAIRVDLAQVQVPAGEDKHFLNTFSIGLYPELVAARERIEGRIGKAPAAALALARVLRTATPIHLRIDGEPHLIWLLFAGNGHYLPNGFAPSHRPRLDDGTLDIRTVSADTPLARTRVVLSALTGSLLRSRVYHARQVRRLDLTELAEVNSLAYDGETASAPDALTLAKQPGALVVYSPSNAPNEVVQRARTVTAAAYGGGSRRVRDEV